MTKKRLLGLTTSYPLRLDGCAGVFIESLYKELASTYTVEVVCPGDSGVVMQRADETSTDRIRVWAVRYAPRSWRVLAQQSGGIVSGVRRSPWRVLLLPAMFGSLFWRCLMRSRKADLIHANWAICGVIAGIVGRILHKPVVTTLRGDDVVRATQSRLDWRILSLAVRSSRKVVCVSHAMADQLRARFPNRSNDVHACLNGVDEAFFQIPGARSQADTMRVLAVGSLIRRKGFDVLIEAVARARHGLRMKVCIVGDGPERSSLQDLALRLGVSDRFDFMGEVPASRMPEVFFGADVFVLSSRSEGRPNVVVEALASGLPVISTCLDGVQGMIDDGINGWLVAVDDGDGLARALDAASTEPDELLRRGRNARSRARTSIGSWSETARCYDVLFKSVLGCDGAATNPCAE